MTDEFQKGLITGLAMQPLQVTTEHATPDADSTKIGEVVAGVYSVHKNTIIIGEVIAVPLMPEVS